MIKRLKNLQFVNDTLVDTTSVQAYITGQELSVAGFEENTLTHNAKYSFNDVSNPLVYGLQILNNMAMVISGKSRNGVNQFLERTPYSTPYHMQNSTLKDAVHIVLMNLEMLDPVNNGLKLKLPWATAFYTLSVKIAQDAMRGNKVDGYLSEVLSSGWETIKEWAYN